MTGVLNRLGWWIVGQAPRAAAARCPGCGDDLSTPQETACSPCLEDEAVRSALTASYQQFPRPFSAKDSELNGKTVLVASGDRVATRVLSTRLRDFGCRVVCSWDAAHALSAARRERPDVILMDEAIPGGDRLTILDRMRNLAGLAFVPVVVLSDGSPDVSRLSMLRGASSCIRREVNLEALASVLREAVT